MKTAPETVLLSPSQITSFEPKFGGCNRKWAFDKLVEVPREDTPSQALGKSIDDGQLQPYLMHNKPFDYTREDRSGYIAASALKYLPKPRKTETFIGGTTGLVCQQRVLMASARSRAGHPAPFAWQGYQDLWLPEGGLPFFDQAGFEGPVVCDFKSTKSIRNWAKSEETLRKDPQAMIYATWAAFITRKKRIGLSWIYMQTQGATVADERAFIVTAEEAVEQFLLLDDIGQKIVDVRNAAPRLTGDAEIDLAATSDFTIKELEPNTDACGSYGGCPYRSLCFGSLSPAEIADAALPWGSKRRLPIVQDLTAGEPGSEETLDSLDLFADMQNVRKEALGAIETAGGDLNINPSTAADTPEAPPIGVVDAKPQKEKKPRAKKEKAPEAESASPPPPPVQTAEAAESPESPDTAHLLAEVVARAILECAAILAKAKAA